MWRQAGLWKETTNNILGKYGFYIDFLFGPFHFTFSNMAVEGFIIYNAARCQRAVNCIDFFFLEVSFFKHF